MISKEHATTISDSTPKHIVSVAAIVLNDAGELLLIKGPLQGWEMPGGQVDSKLPPFYIDF